MHKDAEEANDLWVFVGWFVSLSYHRASQTLTIRRSINFTALHRPCTQALRVQDFYQIYE
jgi:hypothetical protein